MSSHTTSPPSRAPSRWTAAVRSFCILAAIFVATAAAGAAQIADTACSYATCALRVEPRGFGTSLVRGAHGERVGRFGIFGTRPSLAAIVARSDSATVYAREFTRLVPRGALLGLAGSFLTVLPILDEGRRDEPRNIALSLGGAAVSLYGAFTVAQAQRALSRSIWWYNESLTR